MDDRIKIDKKIKGKMYKTAQIRGSSCQRGLWGKVVRCLIVRCAGCREWNRTEQPAASHYCIHKRCLRPILTKSAVSRKALLRHPNMK